MDPESLALLTAAVFVVALLYSSVGHAGASGYIAVMSIVGLAPAAIRPISLTLNVLVATIASWQYWQAGHFRWRTFWPFAVLSVPCAFIGGYITLPTRVFTMVVGVVLLASAVQFFLKPTDDREPQTPRLETTVAIGGGLGLLSGLTGTGGGIFLTPLLILRGWARTNTAAAVSALFILLNSVAGLLGNVSATRAFPRFGLTLLVAAGVGGAIGSYLGSRRLPVPTIKRLLAVVLTIAGLKLLFT